ncbi:MAG: hypothetical protein II797_04410 [Clostridia bacterium]|nr:hypothetical protein [Clostridia bacterium]
MTLETITIKSSGHIIEKLNWELSRMSGIIQPVDMFDSDDGNGKELSFQCVRFERIMAMILDMSRMYPKEQIQTHYFADVGCCYRTVDCEIKNGEKTVLCDDLDYICD